MDLGKAFTYVFEDENWLVKILIGGIVLFIPIVNFIAIGYLLRTLRNVAEGQERPLPDWDNWGGDFVKGLMASIGAFIYALPILVVFAALFALGIVTGAQGQGQGGLENVMTVCTICSQCFMFLYGLLMAIWLPASITFYAVTGEFGSMFRFGELYSYIIQNLGSYLLAVILYLVASFIASFGIILCAIGVIFTSFWSDLVGAHLFGQVWRQAKAVSV